jgi:hypothetical protein
MLKKMQFSGSARWRVMFKDGRNWLAGLYVPENRSIKEVLVLEKHTSPELFALVEGSMSMLVTEGKGAPRVVRLRKGEIIVLDCWHNCFRPGGRPGKALVIEKSGNKTRFMKI